MVFNAKCEVFAQCLVLQSGCWGWLLSTNDINNLKKFETSKLHEGSRRDVVVVLEELIASVLYRFLYTLQQQYLITFQKVWSISYTYSYDVLLRGQISICNCLTLVYTSGVFTLGLERESSKMGTSHAHRLLRLVLVFCSTFISLLWTYSAKDLCAMKTRLQLLTHLN